ncbi:MAG: hypothetical protein U9R74_08980 [Pseudomonadota bacterium]|nr:hypothetical protein [Pseudomonadota bacterium]
MDNLERFLYLLLLVGIAMSAIGTWKNSKGLLRLHRKLPEEGKRKLEDRHPLLRHNGRPMTAYIWLSALVGAGLFASVVVVKVKVIGI